MRLFIPFKKKQFGFSRSFSVVPPFAYDTLIHYALWFVQIKNWCSWFPLLVLMWFVDLPCKRRPASECVVLFAMLWTLRSACVRHYLFFHRRFKMFYPLIQLSLIHCACFIVGQHSAMDLTTCVWTRALCSSLMQSLAGASIVQTSLLLTTRLHDIFLFLLSYSTA